MSLAHSQLSKVFYEKTMASSIQEGDLINGIITIFIGFFVFAIATFGVLMCLDMLECCLHTLRLHWVEFQNKFYKGDGYLFKAFSFSNLIEK